jgi:amino acid permease
MSSSEDRNVPMVEMISTSSIKAADTDSPYENMTELETTSRNDDGTMHFVPGSGEKVDKNIKYSTPLNTTVTAICNLVGAGVLSLPSGFADSSLIVGIFLLFGNASLTFLNLYFIVAVSDHLKCFDYGTVLKKGLGNRGAIAANVALTIFPGGALIAYARVIGDAMPPVLEDFMGAAPGTFITSPGGWILIAGIVFFVLSCRRTLSEMFIIAIFGFATICFAILCIVIRFFDGSYSDSGKPASVEDGFRPAYMSIDLFRTIPLITFSLSVHNNAPHYYSELEDRSVDKMMKVFGWVHVVVVTSYLITAVFGLLTFGEHHISRAKGNILDAYSEHDALLNVARLLMFIHFVAVYPILQMAARKGFNNLVFGTRWLPMRTIIIETACIVIVTCLIAFVIPNIDDVLSINGSICGSIVILMVPSLLYLRVIGPTEEGWTKFKIAAAFSIGYGFVVMVLGLIVSILTIVNRKSENVKMTNSTK